MPTLAKREVLRDRLQSFRLDERCKFASIGGDQEAPFEQAFATLAYSYMADKAPRLLDFMIGFQLVDRNEDNTKAVGIFGFKIGSQWAYAPVFFLNGDLKGHELLYLKDQDMFVPLKENWINYVLNRRPHLLGQGTSQNLQQLGVQDPTFHRLAISPRHTKFADRVPRLSQDLRPMLGYLTMRELASLEKYAGLDERLDFENFLGTGLGFVPQALSLCDAYPEIKAAMARFYGPDLLERVLGRFRKEAESRETGILRDRRPPEFMRQGVLRVPYEPPTEKQGVQILVADDVKDPDDFGLTEAEREKLLQESYLIRDNRDEKSITLAYDVQAPLSLQNPTETGLYQLLVKPGDFERAFVAIGPHSGDGHKSFATVVRLDGQKTWLNIHPSHLFVKGDAESREDFDSWWEGLPGTDALKAGGTYILVGLRGQATCPFEVREKLDDETYRINWRDYAEQSSPPYIEEHGRFYERNPIYWADSPMLYLKSRQFNRFKSLDNGLYVPGSVKVLEVKSPPEPENTKNDTPRSEYPSDRSDPPPIRPGSLAELQLDLLQKTARLRIGAVPHGGVLLDGRSLTEKAALFSLVRDYGFREDGAKLLLKLGRHRNPLVVRMLKRSAAGDMYPSGMGMAPGPYAAGDNPVAPGIQSPPTGTEQLFNGRSVSTQYPYSEFMPVPSLSANNTDLGVWDYHTVPDPMAMQTAQQAADQGQKQVFDTAMIAGMLKTVRQDSLVDRYLGDLMAALDRLGRILFLFYWHQDDFAERYGRGELPELEDTLRNSFDSLGDLTLFLKKKSIEPYPDMSQSSPNIEDAAGN